MFYANGGTTRVLGSSFETAPGSAAAGSETALAAVDGGRNVVRDGHKKRCSRVVAVSMSAQPITPRCKVFREIVSAGSSRQVARRLPGRSTAPARLQRTARIPQVCGG
jgi:hypothetical protein